MGQQQGPFGHHRHHAVPVILCGPDIGDGQGFFRGGFSGLFSQLFGEHFSHQRFFSPRGAHGDGGAGSHKQSGIVDLAALQLYVGTNAHGRTVYFASCRQVATTNWL